MIEALFHAVREIQFQQKQTANQAEKDFQQHGGIYSFPTWLDAFVKSSVEVRSVTRNFEFVYCYLSGRDEFELIRVWRSFRVFENI